MVEGGNRSIEQRFELDNQDNPYQSELGAGEWIVYVAPDTHLPFRLDQIILKKRVRALARRKRWVLRYDIDYPEAGPANIYALGVPKTARNDRPPLGTFAGRGKAASGQCSSRPVAIRQLLRTGRRGAG